MHHLCTPVSNFRLTDMLCKVFLTFADNKFFCQESGCFACTIHAIKPGHLFFFKLFAVSVYSTVSVLKVMFSVKIWVRSYIVDGYM